MSKRSRNRGRRNRVEKQLAPVTTSCWASPPKAVYSTEEQKVWFPVKEDGKESLRPGKIVTITCEITGLTKTGHTASVIWQQTNGKSWRNVRKRLFIKTYKSTGRHSSGVAVRIHGEKYLRKSSSFTHDTGGVRVPVERKVCPPLSRPIRDDEIHRWFDEKVETTRLKEHEFTAYLKQMGIVR